MKKKVNSIRKQIMTGYVQVIMIMFVLVAVSLISLFQPGLPYCVRQPGQSGVNPDGAGQTL